MVRKLVLVFMRVIVYSEASDKKYLSLRAKGALDSHSEILPDNSIALTAAIGGSAVAASPYLLGSKRMLGRSCLEKASINRSFERQTFLCLVWQQHGYHHATPETISFSHRRKARGADSF